MDFLNNSRNDIRILSTGVQTQSFPDDTGNRLRMCPAGVVIRGLNNRCPTSRSSMRASPTCVPSAGSPRPVLLSMLATPPTPLRPGSTRPGMPRATPSSPPPRPRRGPTPQPASRRRPQMALGSTPPTRRPLVPPPCAAAWCSWLPLDDGPGNLRARDDSGHMNATALRELDPAGAWTPGRFDGALNFPGNAAGGWLRVAPSESLNYISKGLTISAWIKRPAQGDAGGTIVSRQAVGPGGYLYNFQISDNRLRIRLHSGNGYRLDLLGERLVPRDTCSYVLVSYDQTEARLFVDGQLAGNARFGLGLPAEELTAGRGRQPHRQQRDRRRPPAGRAGRSAGLRPRPQRRRGEGPRPRTAPLGHDLKVASTGRQSTSGPCGPQP